MQQIKIGNNTIDYEVIRTDRKTVGIILDNDKNLTIRSPTNTEEDEIRKIIENKTSWILKKLAEIDKINVFGRSRKILLSIFCKIYSISTSSAGI